MFLNKAFHLVCNKMDITTIYHSKFGIKYTKKILYSELFPYFSLGEEKIVPFEKLFLCIDGLKDKYTLLNTNLEKAPHFELMKYLNSGKEILNLEYIRRLKNGWLDFRKGRPLSRKDFQILKNKYNKKTEEVMKGNYEPIKVYSVKDRFFIQDGKHTAALCLLKGIPAKCVEVPLIVYDSYYYWVYRKMLRKKSCYQKHIDHFNQIYSKINE